MKILYFNLNCKFFFLLSYIITNALIIHGQDCESTIEIKLRNVDGGSFPGQKVILTSKVDGKIYNKSSDAFGDVRFIIPCKMFFEVTVSNHTGKYEIRSPLAGSILTRTLSYEADMIEKEKAFKMTAVEISKVDLTGSSLQDSIFIEGSNMNAPKNIDQFVFLKIALKSVYGFPLSDETIILTGVKRQKSVIGITDKGGNLAVYLLKGDKYSINFKYNKKFTSYECDYSRGNNKVNLGISYLGTKEIEKRREAEAQRIKQEEKRLLAEKEKFANECKKLGITIEEGYRRELRKQMFGTSDTVVFSVLNRNKWKNKLIVCDLTCSMHPYATQLSAWYQLNCKNEENLQFVFFNEGDKIPDSEKKIGETGGIFYSQSKGLDSLGKMMAQVISVGCSGDCAENDMEALIKGVKMAKPYKELIAIVDNRAPVRDLVLLKNFNKPVHIILCGADSDWILEDYLLIAWKTKGTIHTIEQDINYIANMSEGQEIKIGNIVYKIMGGEFVRITKI